ncbi:ABC transporter permease [Rhodococcus sp. G-MC3]|uniref:ABC transporter permease n=1 Tax=Rhodococcus sp. G-MC3 TaxID=3046209 RepID=UPI0024B9E278|nr:ABC transporter permease [Rhodococcus sp. G-MC3]MDJ0392378.1 ABC transporter permease [Rhodococcus sp. G-MC3]
MTTLLTAEIRKVTTLNFWWALALPPIFVGICASAISSAVANGTEDLTGELDGVAVVGLFVALMFSMLFAAVFSAVNTGTEFRHDTITTSFLTASSRDRVIAAKIAVTALFSLGYGLIVAICSLTCLLLFTAGSFSLDSETMASVASGLFAVVLWSLIGSGLGLLFGSPTWPSIVIVAWFPFGELIAIGILSGIGIDGAWHVTPSALTFSLVAAGQINDDGVVTSWVLAAVGLSLWAAVLVAAGWLRTRERDIS